MPAKDWTKRIEVLSNVLIIGVAIMLGVTLVSRYFAWAPQAAASASNPPSLKAGIQLSSDRIDWSEAEKTLVLVLSTSCKYCHESSPFYSRVALVSNKPGAPRMVAVFPQSVDEAKIYLADKNIAIENILSAEPANSQVRGTPTLLLVDRSGILLDRWVGKLTQEKENEVLQRIFADVVAK